MIAVFEKVKDATADPIHADKRQPAPSGHLACPTCGFMMGPFDITCPRCEHLHRPVPPQRAPQPRTTTPASAPVQVPAPEPSRYPPIQPQLFSPQPQSLTAALPIELRKWNWGAFTLTLFWTAAMKQWGWFALCFIPYANIILPFYLAIKGNELSWKSRSWESLEQFKATQHVWRRWGIGIFIAYIVLLVLGMIGNTT
jgi:hypothetical protein